MKRKETEIIAKLTPYADEVRECYNAEDLKYYYLSIFNDKNVKGVDFGMILKHFEKGNV